MENMCDILTLIAAGNDRPSVYDFWNFKQMIMTLQLPQLTGALSLDGNKETMVLFPVT